MLLGSVAKRVEDNTGLHPREFPIRIDFEDLVHVLREIEHYRDVAALPGQARTGAARQNGSPVLFARRNRGNHIFGIARYHQADRNLAVIGTVRCVESAAAAIETDFPAHGALQFSFKIGCQREGIDGLGVGTERQWSRRMQSLESVIHLWNPSKPRVQQSHLMSLAAGTFFAAGEALGW
jgi:hypothetical protein